LAVVPQQATLPFATKVEEVVALGRLPHEDPFRGARPADRAAIAAAIERVGVGHLLGRDARELSLGERQLVLLALAVAQATPVLVLDEPTVHLDLRHQVGTMELLVDLNVRDGTTVLAVLHDLGLAAIFFPRLILIDAGRIVADGTPAEVLTPDRIRDVFGVDPAIVRLPAAVGDRHA
jgi:iron complex transport system ATP-binding protein